MSYQQITDFIYQVLSNVPDIGRVYKYERWAIRESEFLKLFSVEEEVNSKRVKRIKGWEITRTSITEEIRDTGYNTATHTYIIRGYLSADDENASSYEFQMLIDRVREALRNVAQAPEAPWYFADPPDVALITTVMLGSYLVHACEIRWRIYEQEERR